MKQPAPALLEREWSPVDLSFFQGSPFDETVTVPGQDWGGTYTATVRIERDELAELVATLTVTATPVEPDTVFVIELSREDSDAIEPGEYWWDARADDGTIRLSGRVYVKRTTTP